MRIHDVHLNCQDGGHYFIANYCCFCLETALSIFWGEKIHKLVDIGSNDSWKRARQLFFFKLRFGDIFWGQVQLL